MRFVTWNIRTSCWPEYAEENRKRIREVQARFSVRVQVRWDKGVMELADDCTFSMEMEWNLSCREIFGGGGGGIEFVSDGMPYVVLRSCWCDITGLSACPI